MRIIIIFLLLSILFSCSSKTTLPKASLIIDTERIIEKAERSLITQDTTTKELIDTSLSLSIATNIPDLKIKSYLLKVNYEIKEGNIENAIKNLTIAKDITLKENKTALDYIKYYEFLIAYITNNQEIINSFIKDNTDYSEDVLSAINILKSVIYIKSQDLNSAEKYAKDSIKISTKKNLLIEKSFALKILSFINLKKNNLIGSINIINESLNIDRSLNLLDYLYWDLEFLAKIYWMKGEKENSLYYYKSAYELALLNKNQTKSEYFKSIIDNLLKQNP